MAYGNKSQSTDIGYPSSGSSGKGGSGGLGDIASSAAGSALPWVSTGLNFLSGLFGGGDQKQVVQNTDLHLVNPIQQTLWNMLANRSLSGGGEFGYGQAAKQAKGQVQQFLADRGVDMGSGFAASAMGDAYSNAAAQDQANRNSFNLQLLGTPLQTAQATGANYIPGSPSYTAFQPYQQNAPGGFGGGQTVYGDGAINGGNYGDTGSGYGQFGGRRRNTL